jgi:hypothetical protein
VFSNSRLQNIRASCVLMCILFPYVSSLSFLAATEDIIVHCISKYYGFHKVVPVGSCDTCSWKPKAKHTGERVAYQIMLMLWVFVFTLEDTMIRYERDSMGQRLSFVLNVYRPCVA